MELGDDDVNRFSYAELRRRAKSFGIKANLKADALRNELRRVSTINVEDVTVNEDDDEGNAEIPGVDHDDTIGNLPDDRSIRFSNLPMKTPAHVTRRKGSRVPRGNNNDNADGKQHPRRSTRVGVTDRTLVDPLVMDLLVMDVVDEGEQRRKEKDKEMKEKETPEEKLGMDAFLSDDEDGNEKDRKTSIHTNDDISAYMSEDEEENKKKVDENERPEVASSPREEERPSSSELRPSLVRQRTFEMERASMEDVRPPLARQRTFEMDSPSSPNIRPPLARQRTFEKERKESPMLDSPGHRRVTRQSLTGLDVSTSAPSVDFSQDAGSRQPATTTEAAEFSVVTDLETSGLTAEELKARIMASIAVTPSALAQAQLDEAAAKRRGEDGSTESSKSCSKDWKKIHSNNEDRLESLVDFYQRKRKRADDAQKSAQKSAAKLSAAKRPATGVADNGVPAKSARALFTKKMTGASKLPALKAKAPVSKNIINNKANTVANNTSTSNKSLKRARDAAATSAPKQAMSQSKELPRAKRARLATVEAPKLSSPKKIAPASSFSSTKNATSGKATISKSSTPNLSRLTPGGRIATKSSTPNGRIAAKSGTPNGRIAAKSGTPSGRIAAKSETPSITPKKPYTAGKTPTAASSSKSPFVFKPTIFSTKDMNLNFGGNGGGVTSKIRPPTIVKTGKNVAGIGSSGIAKKGAALLPSLPKIGTAERRASPRQGDKSVNKSNSNNNNNSTGLPSASSSTQSTPQNVSTGTTSAASLSRLAPSRNTTPGKKITGGITPSSASRRHQTTPVGVPTQKSPWIPAGIAVAPNFNFSGVGGTGNTENVFKFTADGSTSKQQQQQQQQALAKKRFDLKESLKQKLKYKPHRGPLRTYDGKPGDTTRKPFR